MSSPLQRGGANVRTGVRDDHARGRGSDRDDHVEPTGSAQRLHGPDDARHDLGHRRDRRRRRRPCRDRDRRRSRLLCRRRSRRGSEHLRQRQPQRQRRASRHARRHRRRCATRRWWSTHAAPLREPQAAHRGDQRTSGRGRRHDDPADGHPARVDERQDRLRLRPTWHRPRGLLVVVPAARRRAEPGPRVDLLGSCVRPSGSARRRSGPLGAPARGPVAGGPCHRRRDRREHLRGLGGVDPPHALEAARRRPSDGGPQGGQPCHQCARRCC